MRNILTAALLFAILLLAACGGAEQHKYWIEGLTLPPASKVAMRSELDKPKKMLMLEFNNKNGWDYVAGHIEKCMLDAGYESTEDTMIGRKPGSATTFDLRATQRMYRKDGARYIVGLDNMREVYGNSNMMDYLPADRGEFKLTVTRVK